MSREDASLIIERLQVEEGFLDGLSLTFAPGLNVLIGPRGTGKTSIVELIRFCLGVPAYSDRFTASSRQHALSILGSGQVTVKCRVGERVIIVSRTADDERRHPEIDPLPLILSQNEIETIGLHEEGRVRLLDAFIPTSERWTIEEDQIRAEVRSLTTQVRTAAEELRTLQDQIEELRPADQELEAAIAEQAVQLETVEASEENRNELDALSAKTAGLGVKSTAWGRSLSSLQRWLRQLEGALSDVPEPERIEGATTDELDTTWKRVGTAAGNLRAAVDGVKQAVIEVEAAIKTNAAKRSVEEGRAREIRQYLDQLTQGAGAVARRIANLREQQGQRGALEALRDNKALGLERISEQRRQTLSALDEHRSDRFEKRAEVVEGLNARLCPAIEIQLERLAHLPEYESAIIGMLRGSGLRYRALSSELAQNLTPRELAVAIEEDMPEVLESAVGITRERASRLVAYGQTVGTEEITAARVEDGVHLRLLVGSEYRDSEELSTGQRCTVILPILLSAVHRALVIDQPEDHLDNAFIVDTVIKALHARREGSQMICATHNANIPVLGEAQNVVLLDSDGHRGFVRHAGPLDHPESVAAISRVMEGGREAFEQRAAFYKKSHRT